MAPRFETRELMQKIPTLFKRDPDDMRHLLPEVHPDCGWVLNGEGHATRKFDGTCVMLDDDGRWWARREVKPGKEPPANFHAVERDEDTGKTVGWEPVEQSPFAKFHAEALTAPFTPGPGTYELVGPKINGNRERAAVHVLVRHAVAERIGIAPELLNYEGLRDVLTNPQWFFEGLVWQHPDGRMAKLKVRDFS